MSALWPDGFVGHEWEATGTSAMAQRQAHLMRLVIYDMPGVGSTRVVSLWHTRPPYPVLPHPTLGSVPRGSPKGELFQGRRYISPHID
jgi:hypothetical protein